ncbi:hypothetical protein D9Q98_008354 [Chlorella vulgaris]|uniref:OTU domain-containing protein n=1 Tax=Chlorella vulgaris TaxID=3077 RepID=A0A9D4YT56_CHLVU|nr:hypothetical protein D9Q98_008354 [Chlorella vulgaris]
MAAQPDTNIDVVIVSHHDDTSAATTDCDEAIAQALEEEEDLAAAASTASSSAAGSAPQQAVAAAAATVSHFAEADLGQLVPSAPPMTPGASSGVPAGLDAASHGAASLSPRDSRLPELSLQQRDRLTNLPSLLADSPLVRTWSDNLLSSLTLTKPLPQVNSSAAAAAAEGPGSAAGRARLESRLRLYCLVERQVKGDGACQFRALSDQLYRTPRLHAFVRECVCRQLAAHPERYSGFVPGQYSSYLADMARSSTWGDGVTLQAAADHFGLRIMVLASYESGALLFIEPHQQRSSRVLWLSFWAEVHYNSLYHADDPPPPLPDDKLLGSRRLHSLLFGGVAA